jgi:hypothetical protein
MVVKKDEAHGEAITRTPLASVNQSQFRKAELCARFLWVGRLEKGKKLALNTEE